MPKPRGGLGRGLDSLIPRADPGPAIDAPPAVASMLPIDSIAPNPFQPRQKFDKTSLEELANSIVEHGVLQPILVHNSPLPHPPIQYEIIAGERRWQAAQLAGLDMIPAIVKDTTPGQQLAIALVENVQRDDLSALEQAVAYRTLVDEHGMTQEQVATRVGKSRVAISNTLRLLTATQEVRVALTDGQITEGHARALLGAATPDIQKRAATIVIRESLSVRATEELVRRLQPPAPTVDRPRLVPSTALVRDEATQDYETRLRMALGTKVELFRSSRGGRIIVHYYNDDQLEGLFNSIVGDKLEP